MKSKIRLPTREEILAQMWKLANAGAQDAVRMACFPEEEWGDVKKMDLNGVTDFKRGANGVIELKFVDRGKLLGGGREIPLCEVEAELKAGSRDAVIRFAAKLAEQYGLQPERCSKFRRASALAEGENL